MDTYFESRDNKSEADIAESPAVGFVLQSHKVGPVSNTIYVRLIFQT